MEVKKSKQFANGIVYCLALEDGKLIETTDTFLPFYTKDAIGRKQNFLDNNNLGDRSERWMIGVSTMSGCPVRCKFCLVPQTQIMMSDFSTKNVEDIAIGDKVIGNVLTTASNAITSYSSSYYKEATVLNVFKRKYSGDIITITTKRNKKITLTPNHRIATYSKDLYRKKYKQASELRKGDVIYSNDKSFLIDLHNDENWIIGWLYGFILGDGVYTKNTNRKSYKTSVSQSNDLIFYAHEQINRLFGKTTKVTVYESQNNKHKTSYRFSFGEKTYNNMIKKVQLIESSTNFKRGFISGFWDAEGFSFCNNYIVRVCNNNISLLEKFNSYLLDLGYNSGKIKKYKSSKKNQNGFVLDTPISCINFIAEFQPLHKKRLFLTKNRQIKKFCKEDVIESIKISKYDGFVYNFETSEHTYVANDILVHNCATGNMKSYRNLTAEEIVEQVEFIVNNNPNFNPTESKEFKINYTRMGRQQLNKKLFKNIKK